MREGQFSLNELLALRDLLPRYLAKEELSEFERARITKALHGENTEARARKVLIFVNQEIARITGATFCWGCGEGLE